MNKQINTALAIAVIIIIAGILGGAIYLGSKGENSTPNISEQKRVPIINQQNEIKTEASTLSTPNDKFKNISFDGCGKIDNYKNESWYQNVKSVLQSANQSIAGILDVCQSLDKSQVIILTNGGNEDGLIPYCDAGSLFQYDVSRNVLAKAVLDDHKRGCVSWPSEFGKRNGNIISLQGSGGDAGCGNTMYYEYNFVDNKIELKKENDKCDGDKQGTWINY